MKLGKVLMVIALMLTLGALWFVLRGREQPPVTAAIGQQDDFLKSRQTGRRGDDPTYSEEIRKNTAITMQTQREQAELKTQIETLQRQALQQQERANRELQQQLSQVTAELNQLKKSAQEQGGKAADSLKTEINQQIENLTATLAETKDNMAKMKADAENRIARLQAQLAQKSVEVSQELSNSSTQNEEENSEQNIPLRKPQKPLPYGNGGAVVVPYGGNSSTNTNNNSNTAEESNLLNHVGKFLSEGSNLVPDPTSTPSGLLPQVGESKREKNWQTVFPVYTLPPNTILSQSKLLTPIIGRVPLGKQAVTDPFFFKVEIGQENLAANGQRIPGVAKMIASGYATGIREQQCVRGYIDSMTFIFVDGRIVTAGKASGEGTSNSEALGYLTDPWGKPCISGTYINNASDYLKSRGLAAFVEAAAQGLSQSQTSYQQNADGNYQAVMDGNVWNFVLGRGIGGSAAEIAQYIRERTDGAFDVVYVPQGGNVQIMLNQMIPIDYDAKARKVNYYASPIQQSRLD